MTEKRFGLNAFWLKMIMLVLMVLDHLWQYLLTAELELWHYAARLVAPVFAYFVAEGMVHTKNRLKYILRLFAAGAVMQAVNTALTAFTGIEITNNIFLTLGAGAGIIFFADRALAGGQAALNLGAVLLLAWTATNYFEGGHAFAIIIPIFYYLRNKRALMYMCYIFCSALPYTINYFVYGYLATQFFMIFAVFPIMLYNGERGPDGPVAKYLFYIFYPLHLWIIVLITALS